MTSLSLSLLGPFLAHYGSQTFSHLRGRAGQALLVLLAVKGQAQQREHLVDLLWPGMPLASGRQNLRQVLYELRQTFPEVDGRDGDEQVPLLLSDRQTISFNPQAAVSLDISQFEEYLKRGTAPDLEAAAALYRGDFLSDFFLPDSNTFEEWAASRRAAYRREVLDALGCLADEGLAQGDYALALRHAQRALALDDLRETAVRQLMLAMVAQDERPGALQIYRDFRERLSDALDVAPALETTTLYEDIRQEIVSYEVSTDPAAGISADTPQSTLGGEQAEHNLPAPATSFIGRERELADLGALLLSPHSRLITILGPGGIGKSRLALEAAARTARSGDFRDGVWFVRLAALDDEAQIASALTAELPIDVPPGTDPERALLDYLRGKKPLLLLDNMEQLLQGSPLTPIQNIMTEAPEVTLLATSRAQLHLQGEQIFPLGGLELPDAGQIKSDDETAEWGRQYDALQLFEVCARRIRPDFSLDRDNLDAVLRIARRVEGFPLGLEMAAAWIELLSPAEIDEQLSESFDLLESDWPSEMNRHHSARALFEWSWRLLDETEQSLCEALSVFRSGFSREAGQAVGQASLKSLLRLSRKSWLQQSGSRFHIHELLRQYAHEKLAANRALLAEVQERHAHYYASYYGHLGMAMRGPDQRKTLNAISVDFGNARMAWDWFAAQKRYEDITGCLLPAMFALTNALGKRTELLTLIRDVRRQAYNEGAAEQKPAVMLALSTAGSMLGYEFFRSDIYGPETVIGRKVFEGAWDILKQQPEGYMAGTWAVYAAAIHSWRDRDQGLGKLSELAQDYAAQGDQWSQAVAYQQLGRRLSNRSTDTDPELLRLSRSELVPARAYMDQALALFQSLGDVIEQARTLGLIGYHERSTHPEAAVSFFERAAALMEAADLPIDPFNLAALAQCKLMLGEFDEGFQIFEQMRREYERLGNRTFLGHTIAFGSMMAMRYGDLELARKLRIQTTEILHENKYDITYNYSMYEEGEIERVAGNLTLARLKYEQALGLFSTTEHENDKWHGQAFCFRGLGDLALVEGDFEKARNYYERTLPLAQNPYEHRWLTALTYASLGRAMVGLGDNESAKIYLDKGMTLPKMGEVDWLDLLMVTLSGIVELLLAEGEKEKAVMLAAFVIGHVATWHEVRWRLETTVEREKPNLPPETFASALEQGRQMTLENAQNLFQLS